MDIELEREREELVVRERDEAQVKQVQALSMLITILS